MFQLRLLHNWALVIRHNPVSFVNCHRFKIEPHPGKDKQRERIIFVVLNVERAENYIFMVVYKRILINRNFMPLGILGDQLLILDNLHNLYKSFSDLGTQFHGIDNTVVEYTKHLLHHIFFVLWCHIHVQFNDQCGETCELWKYLI